MNERLQKIYRIDEIVKLAEFWKNTGEEVVFTNGCFDILHYGHIQSLKNAAALGSKLIVALNSDKSVKKLKGESRPLQNEQSRMAVMAALACVDAVVLFDEDTPESLIDAIIPDILVKGGDYVAENVVGYNTVTENGGKVVIIDFAQGYSTTDIIQKMR